MNTMLSFALSVAANVVAHCICKWLDEQFKAGKHYPLASRKPLRYERYRRGFPVALGDTNEHHCFRLQLYYMQFEMKSQAAYKKE